MEDSVKKIDWAIVAQERRSGMSVPQLAKKYKVANGTVYHHTNSNGVVRSRPSERRQQQAGFQPGGISGDENSFIRLALKGLKQKRANLDRVITALESAG